MKKPIVGIIMGSSSDYETMKECENILQDFKIPYELHIVSAHRTPHKMVEYATEARQRGIKIIIAGAGGAAHLPGMVSSLTTLPVLGVPVESKTLKGLDSLLSIAQMPAGVPTATFAIGKAGAINAGLFAASLLSIEDATLEHKIETFREKNRKKVKKSEIELKRK